MNLGNWLWACVGGFWVYAALTVLDLAIPGCFNWLDWAPPIGKYSGKCALALLAFLALAVAQNRSRFPRDRPDAEVDWEKSAVALPGMYVGLIVVAFPPISNGLAAGLRRTLPWLSC